MLFKVFKHASKIYMIEYKDCVFSDVFSLLIKIFTDARRRSKES
jgi:hypothetical protein